MGPHLAVVQLQCLGCRNVDVSVSNPSSYCVLSRAAHRICEEVQHSRVLPHYYQTACACVGIKFVVSARNAALVVLRNSNAWRDSRCPQDAMGVGPLSLPQKSNHLLRSVVVVCHEYMTLVSNTSRFNQVETNLRSLEYAVMIRSGILRSFDVKRQHKARRCIAQNPRTAKNLSSSSSVRGVQER